MSLRQTNSNLVGVVAFVGLALLGNTGCGGESPLPPPPDTTASAAAPSDGVEAIGEAIGTVRDGHLEFSDVTDPGSSGPGVRSENFGKAFTQSKITFATPAGGPGAMGPQSPLPCTATEYCATVQLTNGTGAVMDHTFVEITDYFGVVPTGTVISWAGPAFPLSTAYSSVFVNPTAVAAADYGSLAAGATGTVQWIFNAGASTSFNFHVKVYASFARGAITSTVYRGASAAPAIDACSGANSDGVTTFFTSGDDGEQQVQLPFPYTAQSTTYDHAVVGANGYVLFYNTSVPTLGLANGSLYSAGPPGLYPFWDDLGYGADGGVCVSTSGAAPNRVWRVTWKNAMISTNQPTKPSVFSAEKVTYSVSIQENTDFARYYYAAPTAITALTQGGSASCGWRGPNPPSPIGIGCGSNGTFIPSYPQAQVFNGTVGNP